LRIAMLSYHTSPFATLGGKHSGGMNVYVRELSRQLAARGHSVDIFTRGTKLHEEAIAPGARLVSVPAGPAQQIAKNELAAYIGEFADGVAEWAQANGIDYDIIHAHYWMSGLAGKRLKAAWGTPMVLMFHTLGLVKNRITALGAIESDERIYGERKALAAADLVIAATPAEQADLQWLYEVRSDHICVIPPGVDLDRFQPGDKASARAGLGLPADEKLLLFVGRIEALKGIDTLIRAAHLLMSEGFKHFNVKIIGGDVEEELDLLGSEMQRLRSLARELGVQDWIEFAGSRTQDELPAWYAAADVVVMPSYSESFGMVALEAMASGRPVVASRVGGLAYLVQDGLTGYHVQEGNAHELAHRIAALLDNPALLNQMGVAGLQEAQAYSWSHMASQIQNLYTGLLADMRQDHEPE
jgi:D-inositol-3-phosphate glycosyltransferase